MYQAGGCVEVFLLPEWAAAPDLLVVGYPEANSRSFPNLSSEFHKRYDEQSRPSTAAPPAKTFRILGGFCTPSHAASGHLWTGTIPVAPSAPCNKTSVDPNNYRGSIARGSPPSRRAPLEASSGSGGYPKSRTRTHPLCRRPPPRCQPRGEHRDGDRRRRGMQPEQGDHVPGSAPPSTHTPPRTSRESGRAGSGGSSNPSFAVWTRATSFRPRSRW